jgi:hypothetical protein
MSNEKEPSARQVNLKTLRKLQDDFDTGDFLSAIEGLDELCANWEGSDGYRAELMKIHRQADEIINDENYALLDEEPKIWDLATELDLSLFEHANRLDNISSALNQLADLIPDEDDFEEDDDE